MGEATSDREPDQVVVVRFDRRARGVGVRHEVGVDRDDYPVGQLDLEPDLHVVHHERVGVARHIEPGRLLIAHRPLDQEVAVLEEERLHPVLPIVQHRDRTGGRLGQDRIGEPGNTGCRELSHGSTLGRRRRRVRSAAVAVS